MNTQTPLKPCNIAKQLSLRVAIPVEWLSVVINILLIGPAAYCSSGVSHSLVPDRVSKQN